MGSSFSHPPSGHLAPLVGVLVSAALAGYAVGRLQFERANRRRERIENEMKLVGHVTELYIFPVKSCRPVRVTEGHCGLFGLSNDLVKDRVFVITDAKNNFLTGRQESRMLLIQPSYHGDDELWLEMPEMDTYKLKIPDPSKFKQRPVKIFGQKSRGLHCGEEVANWLCQALGRPAGSTHLYYHPWETNERDPSFYAKGYDLYDIKKDSCIYADLCSFLLVNEASVDELNSRLDVKVSQRNFRSNIVMKGSIPFEEDQWRYLKIGSRASFRCVRPCTRCVMTTIDPDTGIRSDVGNPLKTLKTYRQLTDPAMRKREGDAPMFGEYLGLDLSGIIRVGDPIYASK